MKYVKLTSDQASQVPSKEKGYTSEKVNGVKSNVIFCSSLAFTKYIGVEVEKIFIEV